MHLLDKARSLHWNGCEGSMGDGVVGARLAKAVVFGPHSLQMKIHGDKLVVLAIFITTLAEL